MADLKLPHVWVVLFPIGLVTFCNMYLESKRASANTVYEN